MATSHRINNFDAIRIIAALVVIYGHANPLCQHPDFVVMGNAVQSLAVKVFFVISGYLVTLSWKSDENIRRYLLRRSLRLGPGLLLVLALTIFLLGPAFTNLPLKEYFGNIGVWQYFYKNAILNPVYALPGVFSNNLYPGAVNGSLWSLPAEFSMYLVLPVFFVAFIIDRSARLYLSLIIAACAACLFYVGYVPVEPRLVVWGTAVRSVADVAPYFLIGSLYPTFQKNGWLNPVVGILAIGVVLLFQVSGYLFQQVELLIVLPYSVITLAVNPLPVLSRAGRFGDPSYGLYLYGFPVQQALVHLSNGKLSPIEIFTISAPISLALAYLSWHLIEKRALSLKPSKPTRALKTDVQGEFNS